MKNRWLFSLLFALVFSSVLSAQASRHGISFRLGVKSMADYEIVAPDPEIASILTSNAPAFGASLRYNLFFGERFSAYAGFGFTRLSSRLLFRVTHDGANGRRTSGSGPLFSEFITHGELGLSYAQPIGYRFAIVGEVGMQLVNVKRSGGSGRTSVSNSQSPEPLFGLNYSYMKNPDEKRGLALQFSPGIRYQLGDHFYITLRGDFIFSGVDLLEQGQFEATSSIRAEPTSGSFQRVYASRGIDLMVNYRF